MKEKTGQSKEEEMKSCAERTPKAPSLQKISPSTLEVSSSVLTTRPNVTPSLAVGGSNSATNERTIPGTAADGGSVGWSVRWLTREMHVDTADANSTVPTDAPAERAVSCVWPIMVWSQPQ